MGCLARPSERDRHGKVFVKDEDGGIISRCENHKIFGGYAN